MPSYHDLHITTPDIPRTSIFNLPFGHRVECTRVGGWQLWRYRGDGKDAELVAGEYGFDAETGEGKWLVLDVDGHVICDGRDGRQVASTNLAEPTAKPNPAGDLWMDLCRKHAEAARQGDEARRGKLYALMEDIEREYPDQVKAEQAKWGGA